MTQTNLLELAKQGNVEAIASLINRQLQPKGITAKVALKDACLQVMLESPEVPDQQALVTFIRKRITGLRVASIERVKVYGRQAGEEFPAWNQEFEIVVQVNPSSPNVEVNATNRVSPHLESKKSRVQPLPRQSVSSTPQKKLLGVKWIVASKFLFLVSIVLLFMNLYLALVTFTASIITWLVYQLTPAGIDASLKQQLKARQKAEEERLNKLEEEEARNILLKNAKFEVKNLQPNLAYTVINEFSKVNARLSVGVSYTDLPGVIASAKLASQQFEKSRDYNVCPYLSKLINQNMFYYELSFECFQSRVKNSIFNNDLEKVIQKLFPDLKGKTVYGNFNKIVQTIWAEASKCSDEIQEILEFAEKND
jgi:hypothetical protein